MNIIDQHLYTLLLTFGVALAVQFVLLRRHINNIADPLVYFILVSAFSLSLAVYAVDSITTYIRIVFYFICFYLGFHFASGRSKYVTMPLELTIGRSRFRMVVIIGCLLFFCANLIMWMKSGVILFSPDPNVQKSEAYVGGFGIVRRINWGLGAFVLMAAFYWWLLERSIASLPWLCVALLTSITGGGKSALLPIIFAFGLYCRRPFLSSLNHYRQVSIRKMLLALLILGTVPVALVLVKETDGMQTAFDALLIRLFYFGDILLYWGQPDLRMYFSHLGPMDYLHNAFGSIFGMLRLSDYNLPLGTQFVQYTLSADQNLSGSLGPNLPFYVSGELFFGPWVAPFHALAIGLIVGHIRSWFVCYYGHNPLRYSVSAFTVCVSITLAIDEGLAIAKLIDFLFAFSLVYALAVLLQAKSARSTSTVP